MRNFIAGLKFGSNDKIFDNEKMVVNMTFENDTIIASKEYVKDHLEEIKKWSEV